MAFKMNRPIIKGTPLHKASIAKAKAESIVSQARTQADASLVQSGKLLGQSYMPAAIDFSIDTPEIDIKKKDAVKKRDKRNNKKDQDNKDLDNKDSENKDQEKRDNSKDKKATKIPKIDKLKNIPIEEKEIILPKETPEYNPEFTALKEEPLTIAPKNFKLKPLDIDSNDVKIQKATRPAPETVKTPKAHENPNYEVDKPQYDSEGNMTSIGGVASGGYNYQVESDQWTYNGIAIESYEVPEEYVNSVDQDIEEKEAAKKNKDLNSNTPSNDSTNVDLLPQPQPVVSETEVTPPLERTKEQKENDKIYNDFRTSKYKKRKMIEAGYIPIESKSAAQMRDDRIYTNAKANGQVRKNMIQGGYTPQ
tara:strand:- start:89 stop:1180 length:1092 start_codon:yes stop_codon:yes gene_type:complete